MAKYTVEHSCGHTQVHELLGPGPERRRRIDWLEGQRCTTCWKAEQDAARKAAPVTAEVIYNAYSKGVFLAVTGGDTYAIKDALKAAGCRWMEYRDNNDLLGLSRAKKAWMLPINLDDEAGTTAAIQRLMDAGVTSIADTTNPIAVALAQRLSGK